MFNRDRWNEILEALNANRFRTFLTAFGVFWGIFILVLLLALTNGLKNGGASRLWKLCDQFHFYVVSRNFYAL